MKTFKLLSVLTIVCLFNYVGYGQCNTTLCAGGGGTYAYHDMVFSASIKGGLMWNYNNNSYGNGDDFVLYSYPNKDLNFYTGTGNITFFPSDGGNIGVGTTSPGAKLDVRGDAIFNEDGDDYDFRVEGDTFTHLIFADASADAVSIRTSYSGYDFNLQGDSYLKGHVGVEGYPDATYELYVYGDAYATIDWYSSDKRFKKNIAGIDNALVKIVALNGKTYEFRTEEFSNRNFSEGRNYGFIAQELKEVVPELVSQDDEGYYAVNYSGIIPILVEALKEQQSQIEELKNILEVGNVTENQNIEDTGAAILYQNNPNPFSESTDIQYSLSNEVQSAEIMIFDMNGTNLKTYKVDISENGKLTINANELKPGMYIYSLIADGKEAGTKRMIITE